MADFGVTATTFKFKFPEFTNKSNEQIELCIEEASRNVDDTWLEGDRKLGVLYLAAHYLQVAIVRGAFGQQIASERIGEISVTYQTVQQPTATESSDLTTTAYGTRFLELCHLNFPAIAVI